jgi:hypothetical protein
MTRPLSHATPGSFLSLIDRERFNEAEILRDVEAYRVASSCGRWTVALIPVLAMVPVVGLVVAVLS